MYGELGPVSSSNKRYLARDVAGLKILLNSWLEHIRKEKKFRWIKKRMQRRSKRARGSFTFFHACICEYWSRFARGVAKVVTKFACTFWESGEKGIEIWASRRALSFSRFTPTLHEYPVVRREQGKFGLSRFSLARSFTDPRDFAWDCWR